MFTSVVSRAPMLASTLRTPARRSIKATATISQGDKLPADVKLNYFDGEGNMQEIAVGELTKGKKVRRRGEALNLKGGISGTPQTRRRCSPTHPPTSYLSQAIIFAVPGAFTPTCSLKHLPGFIDRADELKSKGVDTIACVSVNDAFVMDAWGKSVGADGKVLMLADGSAVFAKAIGAELDLNDKGLGMRSRRYAMLVDDGVVKLLNMEEGGAFTVSSADDILNAL